MSGYYDAAQERLGFCCCGAPWYSIAYVCRGLELIDERGPDGIGEDWEAWYKEHRKRIDAHFLTTGAEMFFYYWADKEELAEHGGSVPGWLTGKGEEVLTMLRKVIEDAPDGLVA